MKKLLWKISCCHGKRQGGDYTRLTYYHVIKNNDGVLPVHGESHGGVEAEITGRETIEH